MIATPTISFIIPAHNEESLLGRTLAAVIASARALGAPFEVIVVDDASTDRTRHIATAAGARLLSVDLRQISAVRNAGARQANGDVLVFVDADTLLPRRTLHAALQALQRGAIGGGARVQFDRPAPLLPRLLADVFMLVWLFFGWAAGCFIFARRDAFQAVGGFDERYFAAEELLISRALKRQGHFVILRQSVVTSARKLTIDRPLPLLWHAFRLALRGPAALRRRDGLDLWYGAPVLTPPTTPAQNRPGAPADSRSSPASAATHAPG